MIEEDKRKNQVCSCFLFQGKIKTGASIILCTTTSLSSYTLPQGRESLRDCTFIELLSFAGILMSYDHEPVSPMFRIDVSADSKGGKASADASPGDLLRQLVEGQRQQNLLLEELLHQQVAANKQRATELLQWKNANPELARSCRRAAETLSRVQTQFLDSMTDEIEDSSEYLLEGDYMLNEFVDRFGPRLAHLNGVLQVLAQLGGGESPEEA